MAEAAQQRVHTAVSDFIDQLDKDQSEPTSANTDRCSD